jgi:hypothetical protein
MLKVVSTELDPCKPTLYGAWEEVISPDTTTLGITANKASALSAATSFCFLETDSSRTWFSAKAAKFLIGSSW